MRLDLGGLDKRLFFVAGAAIGIAFFVLRPGREQKTEDPKVKMEKLIDLAKRRAQEGKTTTKKTIPRAGQVVPQESLESAEPSRIPTPIDPSTVPVRPAQESMHSSLAPQDSRLAPDLKPLNAPSATPAQSSWVDGTPESLSLLQQSDLNLKSNEPIATMETPPKKTERGAWSELSDVTAPVASEKELKETDDLLWQLYVRRFKSGVYVVTKKDESLESISEKTFGRKDLWPKLWSLNPQVKNPYRLKVGMQLSLRKKNVGAIGKVNSPIGFETKRDPAVSK